MDKHVRWIQWHTPARCTVPVLRQEIKRIAAGRSGPLALGDHGLLMSGQLRDAFGACILTSTTAAPPMEHQRPHAPDLSLVRPCRSPKSTPSPFNWHSMHVAPLLRTPNLLRASLGPSSSTKRGREAPCVASPMQLGRMSCRVSNASMQLPSCHCTLRLPPVGRINPNPVLRSNVLLQPSLRLIRQTTSAGAERRLPVGK